MKECETKHLTMVIQDKSCAFGTLSNYEEFGDQYRYNLRLDVGTMRQDEPYIILLNPYEYGQGNHFSEN